MDLEICHMGALPIDSVTLPVIRRSLIKSLTTGYIATALPLTLIVRLASTRQLDGSKFPIKFSKSLVRAHCQILIAHLQSGNN